MRNLAKIFQALSDVSRIRILKMLKGRTLCVCEITAILELATSTVSKHLSILRDAGFVIDTKEGKWINYSLAKSPLNLYSEELLHLLEQWLPENEVVIADAKKAASVDRDKLCS